MASGVNGSATAGVLTNAFQDSGTSKYVSVDASSVYYFEAYVPVAKAASATNGQWQLGVLYQDTSGSNLTPTAMYTALNAWSATTVETSVTSTTANTAISIGTASTGATTRWIRLIGYITTTSTAGRLSIGFSQSVNASSGNPSTGSNAYLAVYKLNTATTSLSGSWV